MGPSTKQPGAVKRTSGTLGIGLLIIAAAYYAWSSSIADGSRLRGKGVEIRSSSGSVKVVGTLEQDVRVTIEHAGDHAAKTALIRIDRSRNPILIEIEDIPQRAIALVEVPHGVSLAVSMSAGELQISNIDGDKRCLLRSGEMVIDVGDPAGYKSVRGFVFAGDVDARAFHAEKGGLWRMMTWSGPGDAVIDAHVSTGKLEMR